VPFDESGDISGELKTFIRRHIHSITLLDVLFHLKRHDLRGWTPEEISLEMRSNPAFARTQLEDLVGMGVVSRDGIRYRYYANEHSVLVDKLEVLYHSRRSMLTNYIYSQPIDSIRDFANAFRIKKD
jgi:hypothetical protein